MHASPPPQPATGSDDDSDLVIVRFDDIHVPAPRSAPAATPPARPAPVARAREERDSPMSYVRADATYALEAMLHQGALAIEAVEVVHMVGDHSDYVLQTWRCDAGVGERAEAFRHRSLIMAAEFVDSYPDPGDGTVRYVLLVQDTPLAAAA